MLRRARLWDCTSSVRPSVCPWRLGTVITYFGILRIVESTTDNVCLLLLLPSGMGQICMQNSHWPELPHGFQCRLVWHLRTPLLTITCGTVSHNELGVWSPSRKVYTRWATASTNFTSLWLSKVTQIGMKPLIYSRRNLLYQLEILCRTNHQHGGTDNTAHHFTSKFHINIKAVFDVKNLKPVSVSGFAATVECTNPSRIRFYGDRLSQKSHAGLGPH